MLLLFDHLSATAGVCAAAPPGFVYASAGYAALLLLCFVSSIWYIDVIGYQSYAPGLFI